MVLALVKLGRTAAKRSPLLVITGLASLVLYLVGVNELILLLGAGLVVLVVQAGSRLGPGAARTIAPLLLGAFVLATVVADRAPVVLWRLFLQFLKFGAVVYGSGYVLFAFLRGDLVDRLGWVTEHQLVDALAVGQLTPGRCSLRRGSSSTSSAGSQGPPCHRGYLPAGVRVRRTPQPLVSLMRRSAWARDMLDGVNVGAVGLMAGVAWQLGRQAIVDVPTALFALGAAAVLLRFNLNSGWVVLAGGALGLLVTAVR